MSALALAAPIDRMSSDKRPSSLARCQNPRAAVHALHEGLIAGTPLLLQPVLGAVPALNLSGNDELIDELTPRENEVLQLLAQGLANKQIALRLGISEHTVKFHSSAIYSKLNVTNRTEAVGQGARMGLIVL